MDTPLWTLDLPALEAGYHLDETRKAYVCLCCGKLYPQQEAFPVDGRLLLAEAAVAQPCVRLAVVQILYVHLVVLFKRFGKQYVQLHVEQIVFKASAHKKFHGKIVHSFALTRLVLFVEAGTLFQSKSRTTVATQR